MFVTADALVCHLIGDYVLQSDWMAQEKVKKSTAALAHVVTYTLPFLAMTRSIPALFFILATHFIIDRWRLARYIVWAKNWLSPVKNKPWAECSGTGFSPDRPPFLAVWLLIIVDNTLHILLNALALRYLA